MNPSEEFRKHAVDCQQMAKFTRDPESKATWNRMAQRWIDCAERFKIETQAAVARAPLLRQQRSAGDSRQHQTS
jgi:hypothetical protein